MSEGAELSHERCVDCPTAAVHADPVPVLGPYIGVVGSVLCSLAGALLLIAPFAFDYRQGAGSAPRSSVVDLVTGGAVLLVGVLTTVLFGGTLHRRLRLPEPVAAPEAEPAEADLAAVPGQRPEPEPEPAPQPVTIPAQPVGDPGGALRDLLTPLVAALAADLRARETGDAESEGRKS